MINRIQLADIKEHLFCGKAILIMGPRQSGKTTLCQALTRGRTDVLWLNGDEPDVRGMLPGMGSTALRQLFGHKKLIVIDEAQRMDQIGLILKIIVDQIPQVQVIATGSSALDLSSSIKEALTGRKIEYHLMPISFEEMAFQHGLLEEKRSLKHRLVYGYYPEVISRAGSERETLKYLSDSTLYKDLLTLEQVKKPVIIEKLLRALALQLGSEVSYNEVSQLIGADKETVERYIDLLEKAYVVFRLPALSRNLRNEIKRGRKIYFLDNGIRNAIINNFNPLDYRQDQGALFENFVMVERLKYLGIHRHYVNRYFWRTTQQQEIDYIEEHGGRLFAYEIKWNPLRKVRFPSTFLGAYPGSETRVVMAENLDRFIMQDETLGSDDS